VVADDTRLLKASQAVYHDRERPSHVVLMVMRDAFDLTATMRRRTTGFSGSFAFFQSGDVRRLGIRDGPVDYT